MIDLSRLVKTDINLLICLYVLIKERSVSRTAHRLCLSQSAVSKQLTKLRQVFDDPLFERQSKGLLPTPKAIHLEHKLEQVLLQIDNLSVPEQFEPKHSRRIFSFDLVETAYSIVFPKFIPKMLQCAPNVTIKSVEWSETSVSRLQNREVDFGIGIFEWDERAKNHVQNIPSSLNFAELLQDVAACAIRKGHPALQEAWSLDTFLKYRHIQVITGGVSQWLLHEVLEMKRLKLNNAVNVSDVAGAVTLCESSDLILNYPLRYLREFENKADIVLMPFPLTLIPGGIFLLWDKQLDNDASHRWLRELIVSQAYE